MSRKLREQHIYCKPEAALVTPKLLSTGSWIRRPGIGICIIIVQQVSGADRAFGPGPAYYRGTVLSISICVPTRPRMEMDGPSDGESRPSYQYYRACRRPLRLVSWQFGRAVVRTGSREYTRSWKRSEAGMARRTSVHCRVLEFVQFWNF